MTSCFAATTKTFNCIDPDFDKGTYNVRPRMDLAERYCMEFHRYTDKPKLKTDRETADKTITGSRPPPLASKDFSYRNQESKVTERERTTPSAPGRSYLKEQEIMMRCMQEFRGHGRSGMQVFETPRGMIKVVPDMGDPPGRVTEEEAERIKKETKAVEVRGRIGVEKKLLLDAYYNRNRLLDKPHPVMGLPARSPLALHPPGAATQMEEAIKSQDIIRLLEADTETDNPLELSRQINQMRTRILGYQNVKPATPDVSRREKERCAKRVRDLGEEREMKEEGEEGEGGNNTKEKDTDTPARALSCPGRRWRTESELLWHIAHVSSFRII